MNISGHISILFNTETNTPLKSFIIMMFRMVGHMVYSNSTPSGRQMTLPVPSQ